MEKYNKEDLLDSYRVVVATGNQLGFLKKEWIPFAEELVAEGLLECLNPDGLYRLTKPTK
jgi:hypothetical protein